MFTVEALEKGIKDCDKNIKIFEEAIEAEMDKKKDYRQQIIDAENMEEKRQLVANGLKIEAE